MMYFPQFQVSKSFASTGSKYIFLLVLGQLSVFSLNSGRQVVATVNNKYKTHGRDHNMKGSVINCHQIFIDPSNFCLLNDCLFTKCPYSV